MTSLTTFPFFKNTHRFKFLLTGSDYGFIEETFSRVSPTFCSHTYSFLKKELLLDIRYKVISTF